ncbi:MAG: DNA modification methylase [Phascolarctobacterium sp.]|nr:DNA modification methylase [Candidatus Phascolarctobacterium caballi]
MKIEKVKLCDLVPDNRNARSHSERNIIEIMKSLEEHGQYRPFVVQKGTNRVCVGNGMLAAMLRLGMTEGDAVIKELTDEQFTRLALADNRTAELAEWNDDILKDLLKELDNPIGWTQEEVAMILDAGKKEIVQDIPPAVQAKTKSKTGELWRMGEHILMVGDATNKKDVETLCKGKTVDLFLTDPPYNVNYTKGTAGTIENDNMESAAFLAFLVDSFKAADAVLKSGGAFYIWHADLNGNPFRAAVATVGWELKQILIWKKNHFTLGRQDYQWQHEPCLYGWKSGAGHYFINERINATILEKTNEKELKDYTKAELIDLLNTIKALDSTVLSYDKPVRSAEHPTMKPVELIAREIKNSTKPKQTILDTFGGSGTTMIAAEQLGRNCLMMEIDPHYADVIIRRWQNFTGKQAVNMATGKKFGK